VADKNLAKKLERPNWNNQKALFYNHRLLLIFEG